MAFWNPTARPVVDPAVAAVDPSTFKAELKHAYDRGRLDERPRRRSFGLVNLILILAAAIGALLIVLAVQAGSFAGGGAIVDGVIARASGRVISVTPNPTPSQPAGAAASSQP